ncbi:MAG: hypothetical protein NTU53_19915 [Planctomycetota bacterium]|nr:hypothetical protein [Planctomycetota bacterium]
MAMDILIQGFNHKVHADRIVQQLQTQQHLVPHQSLAVALQEAQVRIGFCPQAAQLAMGVLQLDPSRKIGRLRQCELAQLSRTIYRLWHQKSSANPAALRQPA